ncbi:MFS general substrate transporter [Chloropicon primus]|uniref:MFS general substrate transporter n=1 Tax=Chloropicon primus TaxID=1764295 RepID=A0A5B8MYQ3_9CHLO|nr:MFS general substrate transporter [Chloropicon primus]UPR04391.1 MFS general substrate transporter [Chloropicon primus]|eukprot:QDZ25186.1 MFS general substrate transporter [Chloropicon primus]
MDKLTSIPLATEDEGSNMESGAAVAHVEVEMTETDVDSRDKEKLHLLNGHKASASVKYDSSSNGESDSESDGEGQVKVVKNNMKILIISAVLGNILEWYDFGVFASFSTELSKAFFTGGRLEEMLKVYGVFASAFFARPLGGFLLGLIGDKFARTLSLQISVVAMGMSALFISVLPTNTVGSYKIGPVATFLLVGARIVQGLSTGGEMVGTMLYMVENVPETAKCFVSAIPLASAIAGTGTGYLVSAIITAVMSEENRVLYGWRIAFFLGVPAGAVGFLFRTCLSESHSFSEASKKFAKKHGNQHPFFYAVKHCTAPLVTILFLCMLVCGYYSGTTWYNEAWLEEFYTELIGEDKKLDKLEGRTINTILLFGGLSLGTLGAAYFVDRHPKIPLHSYLVFSSTSLIFLSPLALWLMARGKDDIMLVVLGQAVSISVFTFTVGILALWLTTEFPPTLQYTSIALSYNVAQCIFGGTMPYISTQISTKADNVLAPSYYVSALAFMGAVAMLATRMKSVREMHGRLHHIMNS